MGIAERKEREKQQRRLEIISAAENVFFSQGYDNSTMDDIAQRVELSKGTLYLYFKGKDELLLEIAHKAIAKLNELFIEHSSKEPDGINKIGAIGEAFIRYFNEYNDYYKILIFHFSHKTKEQECEICDKINKLKLYNHEIMVQILEDGIADGTIRADLNPKISSFILWGESMGVMQMVSTSGDYIEKHANINKDDIVQYFFDFTYNALKA